MYYSYLWRIKTYLLSTTPSETFSEHPKLDNPLPISPRQTFLKITFFTIFYSNIITFLTMHSLVSQVVFFFGIPLVNLAFFKRKLMLEVGCIPVILFEKSGLIHESRRAYSHEIRQLLLTQNTGSRQIKNRETTSEKLKFGGMFDKGKNIHKGEKFCFYRLRRHY